MPQLSILEIYIREKKKNKKKKTTSISTWAMTAGIWLQEGNTRDNKHHLQDV